MFGLSLFMQQDFTQTEIDYLKKMVQAGFKGIFTSMHIPEDDTAKYRERLTTLGNLAKELGLELMVDISGNALEKAGFATENLTELTELGVTGLRMDYHISLAQMAEFSHHLQVALNASTITQSEIDQLIAAGADFTKLEAWHNYYPRPETGLAQAWFEEKNRWLKKAGFTVQAFVPGDSNLRGPLYQGLPTLEDHRDQHPLAAVLALKNSGLVDRIYLGDGGLTSTTLQQFVHYQQTGEVLLHVKACDTQYFAYILGEHENRQDDARDVIRSANARFKTIPQIHPENTVERLTGSVTVDNQRYLRYMGEIQICKRDLPRDEKVNVVATVREKDLPLLQQLTAGTKFYMKVEENE